MTISFRLIYRSSEGSRDGRPLRPHDTLADEELIHHVRGLNSALLACTLGSGHRAIGARLGVPAATVRGWLRVMGARLEATRAHLVQVARLAGVDPAVPKALGSPWRDVLAALGAATAAVTGRFGTLGILGPVTAWQVAAACSAGRLLSPGWPPRHRGAGGNTSSP